MTFPRLNMRVVFMQTDLTYEDAFIMSVSCASRLGYVSVTHVPVAESVRNRYPDGTVVRNVRRSGGPYLYQYSVWSRVLG